MGLIKAGLGAVSGVLADQWKEYFYCESIPADVLAVKGRKKVSGRTSNYKGGRKYHYRWLSDRCCRRSMYVDRRTGESSRGVR